MNYSFEYILNGELIWNNHNFVREIKNIVKSNRYYIPNPISNKIIEIAGWRINVESTIYEMANANSLISNYEITRDNIGFPIQEFARPFIFLHAIRYDKQKNISNNPERHLIEPFIVLYLRFCYWYGECAKYCNMELKNKEIRSKIRPSKNIIKKLTDRNWEADIVRQWYREIVSMTYELMNAVLCMVCKKKVLFTNNHDFVLENVAIEVKTLFKEFNEESNEKYPLLNQKMNSINSLDQFFSAIKEFMRTPKILKEHLFKGIICQKGEMIFLNVPLDQGSPVFTKILEYRNTNFSFDSSLDKGLKVTKDDSLIPVIISFHAIHVKYNIFTSMINVKLENDPLAIP